MNKVTITAVGRDCVIVADRVISSVPITMEVDEPTLMGLLGMQSAGKLEFTLLRDDPEVEVELLKLTMHAVINRLNDAVIKTPGGQTIYVNGGYEGDDSDGSEEAPYKTLGTAIEALRKAQDGGTTVYLTGDYADEDVVLNGFFGGGRITILGDANVVGGSKINTLTIANNTIPILVSDVNIQCADDDDPDHVGACGCLVSNCSSVNLSDLTDTVVAARNGIVFWGSTGYVTGATISNKLNALSASQSNVVFDNIHGADNTVGVEAINGSRVAVDGDMTATTPKVEGTGGVVTP